MERTSREAIARTAAALGYRLSDEELDRLVPVLAQVLPLVEALRRLPLDEVEPAFEVRMRPGVPR